MSRGSVFAWILFIFYSMLLIQGMIMPGNRIPRFFLNLNDKFIHGMEFFILFLTAVNAFGKSRFKRTILSAFIYCIILGAATELAQIYVPKRSCDIKDFMLDVIGTLAGVILLETGAKISGKRRF